MIKDDFDVHLSITFTLPPSDELSERADDIMSAIRKLGQKLLTLEFNDFQFKGAGTELSITNGPAIGHIYGNWNSIGEPIPNTNRVQVTVKEDRTILVEEIK